MKLVYLALISTTFVSGIIPVATRAEGLTCGTRFDASVAERMADCARVFPDTSCQFAQSSETGDVAFHTVKKDKKYAYKFFQVNVSPDFESYRSGVAKAGTPACSSVVVLSPSAPKTAETIDPYAPPKARTEAKHSWALVERRADGEQVWANMEAANGRITVWPSKVLPVKAGFFVSDEVSLKSAFAACADQASNQHSYRLPTLKEASSFCENGGCGSVPAFFVFDEESRQTVQLLFRNSDYAGQSGTYCVEDAPAPGTPEREPTSVKVRKSASASGKGN